MKTRRMLTWAAVSLLALLPALTTAGPATAQNRPGAAQGRPEFVADELLVAFKPGTPAASRAAAHAQGNGRVQRQIRGLDVDVVKVQGPAEHRLQGYQNNPNVEYAELNGIAYIDGWPADGVPNDSRFSSQWALRNTGQTGGKDDADIDALEAWRTTTGKFPTGPSVPPTLVPVSVAIVDTGINTLDNTAHPDLKGKVTERADWANSSHNDPSDGNGHGTHVAGTIAALTNNDDPTVAGDDSGVAGVCPDCTLVSARVCDSNGGCNYDWIASGVLWAVGCEDRAPDPPGGLGACKAGTQRAKVINISLGGTYNSITLGRAIKRAWDRGAVIACAAGNNNNSVAFYPAAHSECIAVGATDSRDQKASFSNFGSWVDVAAPGVGILSTVRTGGYESWSGTSMATPHVTGVAALLWANGASSPTSVRSSIESSAIKLNGNARQLGNGRINACRALKRTDCGSI